nr:thioesterase family protein [Brevibacterium daeguense]
MPAYRTPVVEDWIDYNGHLSEAYYVLVFGFATDQVMAEIGLGPEVRQATGASLYTVEAHVRYVQEVPLGAELTVTTTIVGSGAKKLHLAHEMSVGGEVVATEEVLCLHVSGQPAASAPFAPEVAERIAAYSAGGAEPTRPEWVGRAVGQRP